MNPMRIERRRFPRIPVPVADVVQVEVEVRRRIRLLDISLSGALISCETALPVGTKGHVRVGLASLPFNADLQVKREQTGPRRTQDACLGTMFGSMDEASRRSLDEFLRRGSE